MGQVVLFTCLLWRKGEGKKGGVREGVELIRERPAVTRRWRQVRDTWRPQEARSHWKGRRKACSGWVYAIICSLHPACLGHVSPAASLGTAWNFLLLFLGLEILQSIKQNRWPFGDWLSSYVASKQIKLIISFMWWPGVWVWTERVALELLLRICKEWNTTACAWL